MKAQRKIKHLLMSLSWVVVGIFMLSQAAHATKVGLSADYPVAAGNIGQDFTSNIGGTLSFYPDPLLDPKIENFMSVGYHSLTVKADAESSFRMIPVFFGLELPGKVFEDLKTTFGIGLGAAFTYISVPSLNSVHINTYFAAQIKPGLEWDLSKEWAITGQVPVIWVFSSKPLTYLAYTLGLQFSFGKGEQSSYEKR